MPRYLAPVIATVLLIGLAAWVQGNYSERWSRREVSEEQKEFAARLKNVPTSFGDWVSDEAPTDPKQMEAARAVGHYSRVFHNRLDPRKRVSVFVVTGHGKDMTIHTPDQCYKASGFTEVDEPTNFPVNLDDSVAYFRTNRFSKGESINNPQKVRIFWSFAHEGEWTSPAAVKYVMAARPALFKIYVMTDFGGLDGQRPDDSTAVAFLREFMPKLNAAIFNPTESPAAAAAAANAAPGPEAADTVQAK